MGMVLLLDFFGLVRPIKGRSCAFWYLSEGLLKHQMLTGDQGSLQLAKDGAIPGNMMKKSTTQRSTLLECRGMVIRLFMQGCVTTLFPGTDATVK